MLAPTLDPDRTAAAPIGESAGMDRIGQDAVDGVVDRRLPDHAPASRPVVIGGHVGRLLPEPEMDLPNALQLGEFVEHLRDRLLDPQIGDLIDANAIDARGS